MVGGGFGFQVIFTHLHMGSAFIVQYSLQNLNFRFHYWFLISILVCINLPINQFRNKSKLYKPVFHGNIQQSLPWITGGHFRTYALPWIIPGLILGYMSKGIRTIRHSDYSAPELFGTKVNYSIPGLFGPGLSNSSGAEKSTLVPNTPGAE